MRKVAVIGGGLTGLSAAFYLRKLGAEGGRELSVTLLEASGRLGGIVNTLRRDGYVIERGPDSFLGRKLAMVRLAEELGLAGELTGTNPAARKTYMAFRGRLHPMPTGLNLGIPTDLGGLARTALLTPEGKARVLQELHKFSDAAVLSWPKSTQELRMSSDAAASPRAESTLESVAKETRMFSGVDDGNDMSVGQFLEERFGREMVERICEPLLAGIHAGDLYRLGLKATFPQFAELASKYGSLMRGMMQQRKELAAKQDTSVRSALQESRGLDAGMRPAFRESNGRDAGVHSAFQESYSQDAGVVDYGALIHPVPEGHFENGAAAKPGSDSRDTLPKTAFLTFRRGLSSLIEALESRLRDVGCEIRLNARVVAMAHSEGKYVLRMADGTTVEADDVVIALPAYAAADLLRPWADVSALDSIRYVSVANVVMGFDEGGPGLRGRYLDGSGFLVPKSEGRAITATTWTSAKWLQTAPPGKRLIRCYVGRSGEEQKVEWEDGELTAAVCRDLRDLMGVEAEPEFVEITRLRRSMPQYPVGHVAAIAAFREGLARDLPSVYATGAAFGGVGLPDCVAQGRDAAERFLGLR